MTESNDHVQDTPTSAVQAKPWSHAMDYLDAGWTPLRFKVVDEVPPAEQ